ncbi:hypothetical protein [Kineococcus sp. SYSU DK018]|uniref:hypothetical protein n=1 Tax=Kineococcus sp. SYSU DK018 TaxID=3383139 RepID=UPI003D7C9281
MNARPHGDVQAEGVPTRWSSMRPAVPERCCSNGWRARRRGAPGPRGGRALGVAGDPLDAGDAFHGR